MSQSSILVDKLRIIIDYVSLLLDISYYAYIFFISFYILFFDSSQVETIYILHLSYSSFSLINNNNYLQTKLVY